MAENLHEDGNNILPVRRRIRWIAHDYREGTYFVTICTYQREPLLKIPAIRTIVQEEWEVLPQRFAQVALDEFVIMPDHIHCILQIQGRKVELSSVIGAYKSITTRQWCKYLDREKQPFMGRFWQGRYHDHIIHNQKELEQIQAYIRNNPLRREERYKTKDWNLE